MSSISSESLSELEATGEWRRFVTLRMKDYIGTKTDDGFIFKGIRLRRVIMSTNEGPVAEFFKMLASKTSGYKTISGVVLTVGGGITLIWTPEYREVGIGMIVSGLQLVIVGVTHKFVKRSGKAEEKFE